jgi:hypothetical protein
VQEDDVWSNGRCGRDFFTAHAGKERFFIRKSDLVLLATILLAGCSSDKKPIATKASESPQGQEVTPTGHEAVLAQARLTDQPDSSTAKTCDELTNVFPAKGERLNAIWTVAEARSKQLLHSHSQEWYECGLMRNSVVYPRQILVDAQPNSELPAIASQSGKQ